MFPSTEPSGLDWQKEATCAVHRAFCWPVFGAPWFVPPFVSSPLAPPPIDRLGRLFMLRHLPSFVTLHGILRDFVKHVPEFFHPSFQLFIHVEDDRCLRQQLPSQMPCTTLCRQMRQGKESQTSMMNIIDVAFSVNMFAFLAGRSIKAKP